MKKNKLFVINLVLFVVTLGCMLFLFDKNISNVFAMESIEVNTEEGLTGNNENFVYNTASENDRSNKEGVILGIEKTLDFQDLTDVKHIDNANYFLLNPQHKRNDGSGNIWGTCTTVATQMLMGYHNYYSDRRIIPYEANGKEFLDDNYGDIAYHPAFERNFVIDQGCKFIGTTNFFYQELFDLTPIAELPAIGQAAPFVVNGAKKFIEKYTPESARDNISISWNLFSKSIAQSEIDAGRPIILIYQPVMTGADSFHVVVAYGYGKLDGVDGFLIHYGWGDEGIQVWVPASWFGFQITMEVNHVHKFENEKIYKNAYVSKHCSICGLDTVDTLYNFSNGAITGLKYFFMDSLNIPNSLNIYFTNSASFKFYTVNKIGNDAFSFCSGIEQILIPSSIVSIESKAFMHSDIYNITFQSGSQLQTIGESAFEDCKFLGLVKGIELPASLESIDSRAFYSCDNLNKVIFENGSKLKKIGKNAFSGCPELTEVQIPAETTLIDDSAFLNCTSLRMIKFDDESNLKIISNQAFMNCNSLSTIRLPASVEEIKNSAFWGCSNLNKVTFEENSELSTIGANAFRDCTYLNHNINVAFYLPMNVTSIGEYAFYGCTKINLFYVNYKIQNLGKGVFSGWTANQTIHMVGISSIPDGWNNLWNLDCNANIVWGVNEQNDALFKYRFIDDKTAFEVSIGENVFKDDLPPVLKIPSSYNGIPVKRIANNAFTFRSYIYEVEIPDSIETIGEKAFYLCLDLEKITFSSNSQLKNIQDYAFSGSKIEEIVIPASVTYIGNNVFRDCYKLETIEVESSSNDFSCENGILYNKTKTKLVACPYLYSGSLVIPNTVTEIQNSAFANCKNLDSITIPAYLTIVPAGAFFGCVNLRYVNFAKTLSIQLNYTSSVKEIGNSAFEGCISLKSINLPGNVSKIGDNAFKGCTSLGTDTQLDGSYLPGIIFETDTEINSIGNSAFFGCVGLKEFTFPYGVASIGESAFEDCTKLKSIHISATVRTIGSKAFKNCKALYNVNIFSSSLDIGSYAFADCVSLKSIIIPDGVKSMGDGTFENCDYLTIYTEQDRLQMQSVWIYDWNSSHRPVFWSCTLNIYNEVVSFKKISAASPNGSLDYPNAVNGISGPFKFGYILEGWYNNAQLTGTTYTVKTIVNAPDGTYYVKWKKPTVQFHLNGGTGNFSQLTVDAYATIKKPINPPTKTGSIFKYWALSDDLSKEYDWDKPITEDIVLVAVWELKNYSVVFDLNGGNADISELTVQHGATINEPSDAPQKSGYFFKYWALSTDLTKEYDWQTPVTGDVTLVAVWGQITTPDGLKFTLINNGAGYEVSDGSAKIDGVIELPSAYNGKPVIKIASNGFLNCSKLSGIIIPSSVTAIGKDAFKGTAIWDDSNDVVYADKWVVGYKLSIGDLVLKSDTIGISDYAFYGKGIVGINLPSSLKYIGANAFENCNKLTEVIFADNGVL